jgi:inosine/xanthosine triphosphatase
MHIAVGSTNPVKTNSARAAFEQAFPGQAIEVHGFDVPSGIREQPWGDHETRSGALQRALAAAAAFEAAFGHQPDFAVGLEGGVIADDVAAAHPSVPSLQPQVDCFAWMAVLRLNAALSLPKWGLSRTATFRLPPKLVALMRGADGQPPMELGHADDVLFGGANSKQKGGTVDKVTRGVVDRTGYYLHALHLALAPFVHDDTHVYAQP